MISPFPYKWARFGVGYVQRLKPAAWFRFRMGITVTGAGVSQWDDQSGNGRHLKQGTDGNRPAKQADGSILFDGTAHYLKCDAFTLNQPETVYILFKQVSWTNGRYIFDGNAVNGGALYQTASSPRLDLYAGSTAAANTQLAIGVYGALAGTINGASSTIQVNSTTTTTGNAGVGNMGGFTLGAAGNNGLWSNIQVKEVLIYPEAHDADQRIRIARYLTRVGEMGVLNG